VNKCALVSTNSGKIVLGSSENNIFHKTLKIS